MRGIALTATLCLIWALTFIAQRTALREAPPLWIAAGRTLVGALVLSPLLRQLRTGRGWRIAAGLALTNIVGFVGLQLIGLKAIGAGPRRRSSTHSRCWWHSAGICGSGSGSPAPGWPACWSGWRG